jgi:hypothetical protein
MKTKKGGEYNKTSRKMAADSGGNDDWSGRVGGLTEVGLWTDGQGVEDVLLRKTEGRKAPV